MKVRVFSEDHPKGLEADWPAIPREGEVVTFEHRGGEANLGVKSVRWLVDTNGSPIEVHIQLTY